MSPAFPSAMMRAVSWTASPLMPPGTTSTSPVWIPARMSRPMPRTAARISSADCTARAAPDLERGAVIHPAIHGTGQHESHVMELAACRPGDGAHMLRPPPAGLQHEPADHHLSDPDRARRCPLEREDFVGTRQVLRSRRSCVHP